MIRPYTTVSSKIIFSSKYFDLYEDEFTGGNGARGKYYFYAYQGEYIHAVAIDKKKEYFILTRQYRYPVGTIDIDVAGGGSDDGENYKITARRELEEETGYTGGEIVYLGKTAVESARSKNWLYEYLILDAEETSKIHGGEPAEVTEVFLLPISDAWNYVKDGKFSAHSCSTIVKALLYLKISP